MVPAAEAGSSCRLTVGQLVLAVALVGGAPPGVAAMALTVGPTGRAQAQQFRDSASRSLIANDYLQASLGYNCAAALEQTDELLSASPAGGASGGAAANHNREGPSVTYHLKQRFTIPSRNDEQLIEVARLELSPQFFYKAVPVLTPHVYRLASLANTSEFILLPGQATMYLGSDFVGQMDLPLVAIGGLTLDIAPELAKSCVTAAVISDLLADGGETTAISARAKAWQAALA